MFAFVIRCMPRSDDGLRMRSVFSMEIQYDVCDAHVGSEIQIEFGMDPAKHLLSINEIESQKVVVLEQ